MSYFKLSLVSLLVIVLAGLYYFYHSSSIDTHKQDRKLQSTRLIDRSCDFHFSKKFSVSCYYFRTHDKEGFSLPLALIKNKSVTVPARDLLIQIPGGPGQGYMTVAEEIQYWGDVIHSQEWEFDILLYDPRGTGQGKHAWFCRDLLDASLEIFARDLRLQQEYEAAREALLKCHGEFVSHLRTRLPAETSEASLIDAFSAVKQSEDIGLMIDALGYESAHLFATSYGTRVALLAASHASVRSLILDAVYPFEYGLSSQEPRLLRSAFDNHERIYSQYFPGKGHFFTLFKNVEARLKREPLKVPAHHFHLDTEIPFVLTQQRLLDVVFNSLYRQDIYVPLYRGLSELSDKGHSSAELRQVLDSYISNVYDRQFNSMVFFATECSDNRKESRQEIESQITSFSEFSHYFKLGLEYDVCDIFKSTGRFSVQGRQYIDKPTLIFSGEYDPITPAQWGKDLVTHLPRARHIIVPGAGHGVLHSGACDLSFVAHYVKNSDVNLPINCENLN